MYGRGQMSESEGSSHSVECRTFSAFTTSVTGFAPGIPFTNRTRPTSKISYHTSHRINHQSATTFISLTSSKDCTLFDTTFLIHVMIWLIQAMLVISGMFPPCCLDGDNGTGVVLVMGVQAGMEMDGLLCDIARGFRNG